MSNQHQLLLLCDHIKLSLLERSRAISLNLDPNPTSESNISRSLESLREGIESLSQRSSDTDALDSLRNQYRDLYRKFHGDAPASSTANDTLEMPNDSTLEGDFLHAKSRPGQDGDTRAQPRASNLKSKQTPSRSTNNTTTTIHHPQPQHFPAHKAVRFRDNPSSTSLDSDPDDDAETRAQLFPSRYTDNPVEDSPSSNPIGVSDMSNTDLHAHHQQVLLEQDSQLDTLILESINRQRHLAMDIGDELDDQAELLEDVESGRGSAPGEVGCGEEEVELGGEEGGGELGDDDDCGVDCGVGGAGCGAEVKMGEERIGLEWNAAEQR